MTLLLLLACTGPKPSDDTDAPDDTAPVDTSEPVDPDGWAWDLDPTTLLQGDNPCAEPRLMRVERVIDGDTADMRPTAGGDWIRVRFIGVDTPELGHDGDPDECYAAEARDYLRHAVQGRVVWLTFDGTCADFYDRTLAYVFNGPREDDFVNRHIVAGGYGYAFPWDGTATFEDQFEADEANARANQLGLWGACQ